MLTNDEELAIKEHYFINQIMEATMKANSSALIIEDKKKMFLAINQQQQQQENEKGPLLSIQSKLIGDLLMNIIESRQRILIQRIQFNRDINKTFFNADRDDNSDDDDADDKNSTYHSNSDIDDNMENMDDNGPGNWIDKEYIDYYSGQG